MLKKNMRTAVATSIVTLLPVIAGLILWNRLPERMATHWNFAGEADGFSGRAFAVIGIPLFLLAVQWLSLIATQLDKRNAGQSGKVMAMVMWIVPVVSVMVCGAMYAQNMGMDVSIERVVLPVVGVVFIVIGNYLPKCTRNSTIGIRLPWTLESDEVWNATHRFAGPVWMVCGIAIAASMFLPGAAMAAVMLLAILAAALVPGVYAWRLSKKRPGA